MVEKIAINVNGQGLTDITHFIAAIVSKSNQDSGICNLLVTHTSASLTIQENADPSAREDLEQWLNRLVPENDPIYTHTQEGADDMPAHIKSMLTATTLSIPIINNQLALGIWQGIYLWEHRRSRSRRTIVVHIGS